MLHAVIGLTREETRAARVLRLSKVTEQHAQEQLHNSPWSRLTRNGILASGDMGDRVMQTAGQRAARRCGGGCASRRAVEAGGDWEAEPTVAHGCCHTGWPLMGAGPAGTDHHR